MIKNPAEFSNQTLFSNRLKMVPACSVLSRDVQFGSIPKQKFESQLYRHQPALCSLIKYAVSANPVSQECACYMAVLLISFWSRYNFDRSLTFMSP